MSDGHLQAFEYILVTLNVLSYLVHVRKSLMAAYVLTIYVQMHMVHWYSGTSLFKSVNSGSIFETAVQCIVNCWPS